MQVRFNNDGCFIERIDQNVVHGHREGRMFIVASNEVKSAMFAKGLKVESDLNLWHKRIGYISFQKFQNMQSKGVILRLPNFTATEITSICEPYQFGKQRRPPFPKE